MAGRSRSCGGVPVRQALVRIPSVSLFPFVRQHAAQLRFFAPQITRGIALASHFLLTPLRSSPAHLVPCGRVRLRAGRTYTPDVRPDGRKHSGDTSAWPRRRARRDRARLDEVRPGSARSSSLKGGPDSARPGSWTHARQWLPTVLPSRTWSGGAASPGSSSTRSSTRSSTATSPSSRATPSATCTPPLSRVLATSGHPSFDRRGSTPRPLAHLPG